MSELVINTATCSGCGYTPGQCTCLIDNEDPDDEEEDDDEVEEAAEDGYDDEGGDRDEEEEEMTDNCGPTMQQAAPAPAPPIMAYANNAHGASRNAANMSIGCNSIECREHALAALDSSADGDHREAFKAHIRAAKGHEEAATSARKKGKDDQADLHDNAAAGHRRAASMHRIVRNQGATMNADYDSDILDLPPPSVVFNYSMGEGRYDVSDSNVLPLPKQEYGLPPRVITPEQLKEEINRKDEIDRFNRKRLGLPDEDDILPTVTMEQLLAGVSSPALGGPGQAYRGVGYSKRSGIGGN
jgi:hypothetical protein